MSDQEPKVIRCDRYSRDEFLRMFTNPKGEVSAKALEYVDQHPKDVYDTDDEIAIRSGESVIRMRSRHYLGHGCGWSKNYEHTDDQKWRNM